MPWSSGFSTGVSALCVHILIYIYDGHSSTGLLRQLYACHSSISLHRVSVATNNIHLSITFCMCTVALSNSSVALYVMVHPHIMVPTVQQVEAFYRFAVKLLCDCQDINVF